LVRHLYSLRVRGVGDKDLPEVLVEVRIVKDLFSSRGGLGQRDLRVGLSLGLRNGRGLLWGFFGFFYRLGFFWLKFLPVGGLAFLRIGLLFLAICHESLFLFYSLLGCFVVILLRLIFNDILLFFFR
jgi:hypothetical protein